MVWWKVNDFTFLDSTPQQTVGGGTDKEGNPLPTTTILTPDGLRVVCDGLDNNPEKIGKHMLEVLNKFKNEGVV